MVFPLFLPVGLTTQLSLAVQCTGRRVPTLGAEAVSSGPSVTPPAPQVMQSSSEKVAHNVAMRFRDKDKKFAGELGQCSKDYVNEYRQMSHDNNFTKQQKLHYLQNLLQGDAKRYYLEVVAEYATTFQKAVDMVEREYNSYVRQKKVKNLFKSLRMSRFVNESLDPTEALGNVCKAITRLIRQAHNSQRGDAHKVDFLSNAVSGYDWTIEPLFRVATHGLNFQQLYGELEAALQLSKDAKVARMKEEVFSRAQKKGLGYNGDNTGILFAGQVRYGREPSWNKSKVSSNRRVGAGTTNGKVSFDPLSVAGCFNCDEHDHMIKDCPHPLNAARAAVNKLE